MIDDRGAARSKSFVSMLCHVPQLTALIRLAGILGIHHGWWLDYEPVQLLYIQESTQDGIHAVPR